MPPNADAFEHALPLSRWELALGAAIGGERLPPLAPTQKSERAALAAAVLPALRAPPCVVSFSGGFDSSAVLAAATDAARREGLPAPVPVSLRFPGRPGADEARWQESVVAHLGLIDWERIELGDELDFLGEIARTGLGRHGLLWPANVHFHVPVLARARGGSVLTGLDGDGLFGAWRWQAAVAARRAGRAGPRDFLRVVLAEAPSRLRAAALFARTEPPAAWLRPRARVRIRARLARERASEPTRWDQRVSWYAGRRYLRLGLHSLALLAADHDVRMSHPLLDPGFLASVGQGGGRAGYGDHGAAFARLFGDLLPPELLGRRGKAEFGAALWGRDAREFAERWDGGGLDAELIDAGRLRSAWHEPRPALAAATLLQAAWLSARRNGRPGSVPPARAGRGREGG